MLTAKRVFAEIFDNDEAFRLFCSIAASDEAQGGWENGRIAALVPESAADGVPAGTGPAQPTRREAAGAPACLTGTGLYFSRQMPAPFDNRVGRGYDLRGTATRPVGPGGGPEAAAGGRGGPGP